MSVVTNLLSANDAGLEGGIGTWFAGSNTTVARVTSPAAHTGSASLRLTSTAAGQISAVTGMYAVTPNVEYEAYAWAANVVAASGRVADISIDWWTSGNVYISSSTGGTFTLPNSTAWSGPVVLVGTAPATAAKASLVIKVTAGVTAGSQQVLFDDFVLGLPTQDAGNLIPYNTSSIEMDTSGWGVSNGTLARIATTGASEGAYSLRATSTASGDMTVTSAARFPVTVGTAYELYPWTLPPATGRSLILEIRWYDAAVAGTLLSTSSRTVATVQTTIPERHTVLGTAPATATHAEVRLRPQTTGAAEVWYFDRITLRVQPVIAGNLLPYSAQSIETGAADWTAGSNAAVVVSAPGDVSYAGAYSLKTTATAIGPARVELTTAIALSADYYVATARFRTVGATPSRVWVDIDWYDASMAWLGNAGADQSAAAPGDVWRTETIGRPVPPGAAFAKVVLLPQATSASQVFYLDEMSLLAAVAPYSITPVASTGSVTIVLNELAGDDVSLYRVDPDGTRSPVRGYGSDVVDYPITGSTLFFEDYETPLGVPVFYEYSVDGGDTNRSLPVTVDPPENRNHVWLTDPGQPGRNMLVWVEKAPSWKRPVVRGIYPVHGAAEPVTVSDVRQSRQGDLLLYTFTEDDETALNYLLDTGSTLLVRARPGWGLTHMYVSVGDVDEPRPVDAGWEAMRRWTLPLIEVGRPVGGMAGSAGRTWQDLLDDPETPTWADVLAKYDSWLEVLQGVD